MMSRKIKGLALDSKASVEDVNKARLSKHQSLMQDYEELQKEVNVMRSRLETAKNKKLVLAAEVRFLQRRRRCLVVTNSAARSTQEQPYENASTPPHQTKRTKKMPTTTKEAASKRILPSSLTGNPKKRGKVTRQVTPHAASSLATNRARKMPLGGAKEPKSHSFVQFHNVPMSDLNHRESRQYNSLDLNQKQRTSGSKRAATMRNPGGSFDLNQDSSGTHGVREQPSSPKAPIFDLNEISTGDDEELLHGNVDINSQLELEATESVLKGEQQNDLKLSSSICRNSGGEGPSRVVGKRKISWQDPLALRV